MVKFFRSILYIIVGAISLALIGGLLGGATYLAVSNERITIIGLTIIGSAMICYWVGKGVVRTIKVRRLKKHD